MSVAERFANNATTTLSGSIASGDTSLVVTSATLFPGGPQFRLLLDSEYMLVTAVAGTTFTVTRGVENTTAAAHSNGTTISQVLTSGGLVGVGGSINLSGTTISLDGAGIAGRTFWPTDGGFLYRDNGATWQALGPIYRVYPVVPSEFSWVNQGTSVETSGNGIIHLSGAASIGVTGRFKPIGATSGYTVILGFKNFGYIAGGNYGLYLRDSGGGKLINFTYDWGGTGSIDVGKYNSPTSFSAGYAPFSNNPVGLSQQQVMWFKVVDNGTNFIFSSSCNGYQFGTQFIVSRTDFLTTGADQVGYGIDAGVNSGLPQILIYSFQITIP